MLTSPKKQRGKPSPSCHQEGSPKDVAGELGAEKATLYNWKHGYDLVVDDALADGRPHILGVGIGEGAQSNAFCALHH